MCKDLLNELSSNLWALPMASKLDSITIGLSIEWAIKVYQVIFFDLKISNKEELEALKKLTKLLAKSPSKEECGKIAFDLFLNRGKVTVGISRLYTALSAKQENNYKYCSRYSAIAIDLLICNRIFFVKNEIIKKYIHMIKKTYENYLFSHSHEFCGK